MPSLIPRLQVQPYLQGNIKGVVDRSGTDPHAPPTLFPTHEGLARLRQNTQLELSKGNEATLGSEQTEVEQLVTLNSEHLMSSNLVGKGGTTDAEASMEIIKEMKLVKSWTAARASTSVPQDEDSGSTEIDEEEASEFSYYMARQANNNARGSK